MQLSEFLDHMQQVVTGAGSEMAFDNAREDIPVVVKVGSLPHTITAFVLESHEEGGMTIWIEAEES